MRVAYGNSDPGNCYEVKLAPDAAIRASLERVRMQPRFVAMR